MKKINLYFLICITLTIFGCLSVEENDNYFLLKRFLLEYIEKSGFKSNYGIGVASLDHGQINFLCLLPVNDGKNNNIKSIGGIRICFSGSLDNTSNGKLLSGSITKAFELQKDRSVSVNFSTYLGKNDFFIFAKCNTVESNSKKLTKKEIIFFVVDKGLLFSSSKII